MSNKIHILPENISNQIAAGEVVQRPESVVKELVENSLDAGAKNIAVIVHSAGKNLIHIVDDGVGINQQDLELAVRRHCTSKILSQEDLESIITYGFRGEALASIAAVSLLEIRSKVEDETIGSKLLSEPLKPIKIEPIAMQTGTQIFVRNLFYNTPARRKFLKANLTEFRYISDTMMRFALSNPHIRFTFYDDENLIFDLQPSNLKQRIVELLGDKFYEKMIEIDEVHGHFKLTGFLADPTLSRNSKSHQFLFLNKRTIFSKSISHAVLSVYEPLLEKNRYPAFVINFEVDATFVDVNVHPQKNEVKFEDERKVYSFVRDSISKTLKKHYLIPEYFDQQLLVKTPIEKTDNDQMLVNKMTGEMIEPHYSDLYKQNPNYAPQYDRYAHDGSKPTRSAYDYLFGTQRQEEAHNTQISINELTDTDKKFAFHKVGDFLIVLAINAIYIMHIRNAYRRVIYEQTLISLENHVSRSQTLMFPIKLKLPVQEFNVLDEISEEIQSIGFKYERQAEHIIINSIPSEVNLGNEEAVIQRILESYVSYSSNPQFDKKHKIALSFSIAGSINANITKSISDAEDIFKSLLKCDEPKYCPNGNKTIIKFDSIDISKLF